MDRDAVTCHITGGIDGVDAVAASGVRFFFHTPAGRPAGHRVPFATLVTGDRYDSASDPGQPGVYRLDIGAGKETFRALLDDVAVPTDDVRTGTSGHDFAALDRLRQPPVYGSLVWGCVLDPSADPCARHAEAREVSARWQAHSRPGQPS